MKRSTPARADAQLTVPEVQEWAVPLARTVATTQTDIWNDSCSIEELEYAIGNSATGATANPTIIHDIWVKDAELWSQYVRDYATRSPGSNETDIAWAVVGEMSIRGARLLEPVFAREGGRKGRLSIQTDPTQFMNAERMVDQAARFDALAPNVIVKFPATPAGIRAMEEATALGVSVNATVSFTVAQAIAAAEAIERGLRRREAGGQPTDTMGPVVTLMMGRLEDWLRIQTERNGIVVEPAAIPWAGVAVFKRAYEMFQERGYRARLLGAAIRHHYHWSELIGGDVVLSMPSIWQRRFNASSVEVRSRIDDPVDPAIVKELSDRFPDFVRAYAPGGLTADEFVTFPPTIRTLRAFVASYHDLLHDVSDALLPDTDRVA